jgi:hypothetical protein
LGSDLTSGFWQAVAASFWMVATLAGHDGPLRDAMTTTMISSAAPIAVIVSLRPRNRLGE